MSLIISYILHVESDLLHIFTWDNSWIISARWIIHLPLRWNLISPLFSLSLLHSLATPKHHLSLSHTHTPDPLQFPSMQQELWLRAKSQVIASLKAVCAMRAAALHPLPPPPYEHELKNALSSSDGSSLRPTHLRTRMTNGTFINSHGFPHGHNRGEFVL